jgi:hypothetical protein
MIAHFFGVSVFFVGFTDKKNPCIVLRGRHQANQLFNGLWSEFSSEAAKLTPNHHFAWSATARPNF